MYKHWNNYSAYLKRMYGDAVYRIGIDGGFSCPNRLQDGHGGCSFCDGTGAIAVYQRKSESGFFRTSPYSEDTFKVESPDPSAYSLRFTANVTA